ncbi:MAG: hypothetical protein WC792_03610 [Candidatus Micrarchaeia archaeon]|jgi:hypothetical protein
MGFLDFLFAAKPLHADAAAQPKPAGTNSGQVDLQGALKLVARAREEMLSAAVPECAEIAGKVRGELSALRDELSEFSRLEIDPQMQHYKIARQMKPEFEKRALPLLDSLQFPTGGAGFSGYAEFHKALSATIAAFTKISFDNRYLLVIFPENFSEIGETMKRLAKLSDGLGGIIESKSAETAEFASVARELRDAESALEKVRKAAEFERACQEELAAAKAAALFAEEKMRGISALSQVREKISQLEREQSQARFALREIFSPLGHPLKKFAKTCPDHRLAKAALAYADDAENAAMAEPPELPMLSKACAGLRNALEGGELEKDARAKNKALSALDAAGNLAEVSRLVQRIALLGAQMDSAQKSLAPLFAAEREAESAQKTLSVAEKKLSAAKQESNNLRQGAQNLVAGIEGKMREKLGISAKITASA